MFTDPEVLSAVIAAIYDASVDPRRWTLALKSACDFVGGAEATMFWQGPSLDQADALHLYNDDPHYTRLYLEELAPFNPVFPAAFFQKVGAVHTFGDLVPPHEMVKTWFYDAWMAPQGFCDALAVMLEREATRVAILSFPCRTAIDETARRRLSLLVPHLQRAVTIGRLFAKHATVEAALTETLDRVGDAVFLVTADRRLVFANAGARRMIGEGVLVRAREERLAAVDPKADRAFGESLRALGDGCTAEGITVALDDGPAAGWFAHLLPLVDGARRGIGEANRAAAALFVRNPRFADPTPLEALAKSGGLTASEIRVVEATLRVSGLDAIAEALGISKATVKTHLNRVYRKCSVRNQSELIKLFAGLVQP